MPSSGDSPVFEPMDVAWTLYEYRWRWLLPAIGCAVAAAVFAVLQPEVWRATQALMLRDDASNSTVATPGRFQHADKMKTSQETILELARSTPVLAGALTQVGPAERGAAATTPEASAADSAAAGHWPDPMAIAELRDAVEVVPPSGASFGQTEIFYLTVTDHSPERARALATAICDQIERSFQQLRDAQAASVLDELGETMQLAERDYALARDELAALESEVGGDLSELRNLSESSTNNSDLSRRLNEIDQELILARTTQSSHQQLLALLSEAKEDSDRLLATPNTLLEAQPALRRLKEGLIDAQLATARLEGTLVGNHPQLASARAAEVEVREQIAREVEVAIRGVEADLRLVEQRLRLLEQRLAEGRGVLDRMAKLRIEYTTLVAEVRQRQTLYETAQRTWAEARAAQAAVHGARLLARYDAPDVGSGPIGLPRTVIVAAGGMAGLLLGLGVVVLTVPTLKRIRTPVHLQRSAPRPTIAETEGPREVRRVTPEAAAARRALGGAERRAAVLSDLPTADTPADLELH